MMRSLLFTLLVIGISAQIEARGNDPARPWAAQADGLLAEGRFVEAEAAYVALAAEHPDDPGIWTRIAFVRLQLGNLSSAMEAALPQPNLVPSRFR